MSMKMHYYIQATFGGNSDVVIYGHTENPWMAKQYCNAILKNKLFLESHSSPDEAASFVEYVAFMGTATQFHDTIEKDYNVIIDGEDYIDIFETGIVPDHTISLAPTAKVVTTLADVLSGRFISFAERFLLPYDIKNMEKAMRVLAILIAFIRPSFLPRMEVLVITGMLEILKKHPLLAENKPPFILDTVFTEDACIDIIQYGIVKGWYVSI